MFPLCLAVSEMFRFVCFLEREKKLFSKKDRLFFQMLEWFLMKLIESEGDLLWEGIWECANDIWILQP